MNGIILDEHDRKMALQELDSIRNEMLEKLGYLKDIIESLCEHDRMIFTRAEQYWIGSVENNLSAESGSFLGSMTNFNETLKELKQHCDEVNAGAYDDMDKEDRQGPVEDQGEPNSDGIEDEQ